MPNNYGINPSGNRGMEFTGIAAEDKPKDKKTLRVFVNELTPVWSGKLEASSKLYKVAGGAFEGTALAANCIIALWKGDTSNRRYCPDVVKGEEVKVYTDARNDSIWYWEATTKDQKQRVDGERVGQIANNAQNPEDLNESNTYGNEINTEGKYVKIYTSKSKGEKYAYTIIIDPGNNKLTLADDSENFIEINSSIPRIVIKNKNGCFMEMSEDNVNITAVKDLTLKAGNQMIFATPALTLENATGGAGAAVWNVNEIAFNTKSFTVNGACIGMYGHMEVPTIVSNHINSGSYSDCGGISGKVSKIATTSLMKTAQVRSVPNLLMRNVNLPISPFGVDLTGTYRLPKINIMNGAVTLANNTPNMYGSIMANRHSTAWENILESITHIQNALYETASQIESLGGSGHAIREEADLAVASAVASKMEYNRGI